MKNFNKQNQIKRDEKDKQRESKDKQEDKKWVCKKSGSCVYCEKRKETVFNRKQSNQLIFWSNELNLVFYLLSFGLLLSTWLFKIKRDYAQSNIKKISKKKK